MHGLLTGDGWAMNAATADLDFAGADVKDVGLSGPGHAKVPQRRRGVAVIV